MINCIDPVVSMTKTVILMVIRVAPPKLAAAPITAYACKSICTSVNIQPLTEFTILPQIWPMAEPTAKDGTNKPVGAPTPYVTVINENIAKK